MNRMDMMKFGDPRAAHGLAQVLVSLFFVFEILRGDSLVILSILPILAILSVGVVDCLFRRAMQRRLRRHIESSRLLFLFSPVLPLGLGRW